MNQLWGAESVEKSARRVKVKLVPQRTTRGGPGFRIVAFENPQPRVESPISVRLTGLGSARTWIAPVMEFGCIPHRYVQLPGCNAWKLHTNNDGSAGPLKGGEFGSSPVGVILLS